MSSDPNAFWRDPINADIADFLGRSVMDSIRFRHAANAANGENERLRADLTRERIDRGAVERENEQLRASVEKLEATRNPTPRKRRVPKQVPQLVSN